MWREQLFEGGLSYLWLLVSALVIGARLFGWRWDWYATVESHYPGRSRSGGNTDALMYSGAVRSESRDFLKCWTEEESESSIGFLGTISWAKRVEEARDIIWCFAKWSSFKRWTSWKSSLVDCVLLCLEMNLACGLHISSPDFLIFFPAAWEMSHTCDSWASLIDHEKAGISGKYGDKP